MRRATDQEDYDQEKKRLRLEYDENSYGRGGGGVIADNLIDYPKQDGSLSATNDLSNSTDNVFSHGQHNHNHNNFSALEALVSDDSAFAAGYNQLLNSQANPNFHAMGRAQSAESHFQRMQQLQYLQLQRQQLERQFMQQQQQQQHQHLQQHHPQQLQPHNQQQRFQSPHQQSFAQQQQQQQHQDTAAASLLDSAIANSVRNESEPASSVSRMPQNNSISNTLSSHQMSFLSHQAQDRLNLPSNWPGNTSSLAGNSLYGPAFDSNLLLSGNNSNGNNMNNIPGFSGLPSQFMNQHSLHPDALPSSFHPLSLPNLANFRSQSVSDLLPNQLYNSVNASGQSQNQLDFGASNSAPSAAMSGNLTRKQSNEGGNSSTSSGIPMSLPTDDANLSEYQCLVRAQIEIFEAQVQDIECNAQGRNKPINVGQLGIRCKHCTVLPPGRRPCGAVYFPGKLSGLYQAAQNMAINHFTKSCLSIPEATKQRMLMLKAKKSTVPGGGKSYWANGGKVLKIVETDNGLIFKHDQM